MLSKHFYTVKYPYFALQRLPLSIWYPMQVVWCWKNLYKRLYCIYSTSKATHWFLISLSHISKRWLLHQLDILLNDLYYKHSIKQSTIQSTLNQICSDEKSLAHRNINKQIFYSFALYRWLYILSQSILSQSINREREVFSPM